VEGVSSASGSPSAGPPLNQEKAATPHRTIRMADEWDTDQIRATVFDDRILRSTGNAIRRLT